MSSKALVNTALYLPAEYGLHICNLNFSAARSLASFTTHLQRGNKANAHTTRIQVDMAFTSLLRLIFKIMFASNGPTKPNQLPPP